MRIAAFIGAIVVANLVTIGGIALIALSSPAHVQSLIWLPIVALTVLVYGPLTIGSVTSYWDVRATSEAWRYFRRWFTVTYGIQAIGVVAIVVFAVLAGAPVWLPIAFLGAGVLLNVLASRVGRTLRRREESRRPADAAVWEPITRESIVRRILIVAGVFVVVLVVCAVGLSLLFALVAVHRRGIGTGVLFAAEFAFIGAAIACIIIALPLNRMVREHVSRDVGSLRRIAKVVLRGKPVALDSAEEIAAAKYAVVISVSLPFTLAYLALLYIGIGIGQLGQLSDDPGDPFPRFFLGFLLVALVALLPLYIVRIRRARTYARSHATLLPSAGAAEKPGSAD